MRFRVRYSFWNVFLVVLGVVILIACFAFLSYALFPNEQAMHEINQGVRQNLFTQVWHGFYIHGYIFLLYH